MARQRIVVVALGGPGMGKTTLLRQLIAQHPGPKRIVDPSGQFDGDPDREWPGRRNMNDWVDELTAEGEGPKGGGWGPGLVVLDDADRYLNPRDMASGWKDLWLANRHLGLDVLISAHRPADIDKSVVSAAGSGELYLFAQEEVGALEYLSKIPTLKRALADTDEDMLPTEPGYALRIVPRLRLVELVDVFSR